MLQAHLLAYQDAHRYRVGTNHNSLPINAPKCPVHNYQRDGLMAANQDGEDYYTRAGDLYQIMADDEQDRLGLDEAINIGCCTIGKQHLVDHVILAV
jgi:catalase